MPITFDFTEKDYQSYKERQAKYAVDNHPLREPDQDLFAVMMSDEADLRNHGFISNEALQLLGE